MLKSIKIRLYPNNEQIIYMNKLFGCSRFIYNKCLDYKINEYKNNGKSTTLKDTGKYLTTIKSEFEWIKESHSKVLQQSLINLERSYKNFFKNGRGFPKFKSKHNKQSVRFPKDAIMGFSGNRINIIKDLKNIHFKCSISDEKYLNKNKKLIVSGTLTKTKSGEYYFSLLIDKHNKKIKSSDNIIGLDLGIKDFIVTSNGDRFKNLKVYRSNLNKIKRLHKELSRKENGSKNKEKSRIKLAKLNEKIKNIKENYLHKVTNQLINENQVIIIEDLNVTGMMKNRNLSLSIQELSLHRFKEMLKYKAEWYNREVVEIDRFYPSSKLCSSCGYKNKDLKLKDRSWVCCGCGTKHDRDLNASLNILNEGKRIIGLSSPELTTLESNPLGPR